MLKKVIATILSLCVIFSVSVMTVTAASETQRGRGLGEMSPIGQRPSGDFAPPEGFIPPEGEFAPPQNSGEFTPPQGEESSNTETTAPQTDTGATEENQQVPENSKESGQMQGGNSPFGGEMPEGMNGFPGNMQSGQNTAAEQPTGFLGFVKTYSTPITSVVLLGLAFIFVIFYRRKNY